MNIGTWLQQMFKLTTFYFALFHESSTTRHTCSAESMFDHQQWTWDYQLLQAESCTHGSWYDPKKISLVDWNMVLAGHGSSIESYDKWHITFCWLWELHSTIIFGFVRTQNRWMLLFGPRTKYSSKLMSKGLSDSSRRFQLSELIYNQKVFFLKKIGPLAQAFLWK